MDFGEVVLYARTQIEQARLELGTSCDHRTAADASVPADEQ